MLGITGIILAAAGAFLAWWAFGRAEAGEDTFYLWGMGAVILGLFGLILIFLHIRKWWMSEV